ncbi:MAG TPA: 1-(5-phosphoribosyl)-5-[(5-phosphoribosylamino)methylideneamino]imidazole-4-carboxamide isomerase [Nitrososphaeraceae archaeon]|nr:1-(5-phosphoribosyl)-5-[(5-phosphoribosylamino)methylideneamino]imidazole-4-carboxamide isomerase [Nitrososphaeraceae archaeon]
MKIIAAIDLMEGSVVRLVKGDPASKIKYSNNPTEAAQKWEADGADMLHVVDLDAALSTGKNNVKIISDIMKSVQIPVQVTGGIRSVEALDEMLGPKKAAKVVLGTLAFKNPDLIKQLSRKKLEKIVISVDQINNMIMVQGWKETSGTRLADAINMFMSLGVNEFILTTIERDGTLQGPDLETLEYACSFSGAKIIASGGISSLLDIVRLRTIGCTSVILGRAIYDGKLGLSRAKALV